MTTTIEKPIFRSLVAFMLFSLLENVINTVVDPSLIFYIESVGGNNDDYGLTVSAFCVGMTIMMFYFGRWVDSNGNKYQAPLACAFVLGIIGSLIYFAASLLPSGFLGVNAILVGRVVTGMGCAGKMLVQSWIATAIPLEEQKTVFAILGLIGITGQAVGPLLNTLVAEIDLSIDITSNFSIHLNPYNSIGLLVAFNEGLLWLIVAIFVIDPPPPKEKSLSSVNATEASDTNEAELTDILKALTHFDIFFPLAQQFVVAFIFVWISVVFSPVALNMMNWTPVEISKLSAVTAGTTFIGLALTLYLSLRNTSDFFMIFVGNACFAISGAMAYFDWRVDTATALKFGLPVVILFIAHPFNGPANQSSFNKAVFSRPELAGSIGVLQSIYTQAGTVAGIIFPPFVTSYILRDPSEITLSSPYEQTPWALLVPISATLMIIGLLYEEFVMGKNELGLLKEKSKEEGEEVSPDETSKLVPGERSKSTRRSIVEVNEVFTRKYEVNRRMSCETSLIGVGIVNPFQTASDRDLSKELSKSKKEWEHLLTLDEEADEEEMEE